MPSNIALFPLPVNYDGRTLGEVNSNLEEGDTEVVVYDGLFAYPSVSIDATRVIRSNCISARPSTAFVERPSPLWKRAINKAWNDGLSSALEYVVIQDVPNEGISRYFGLIVYHLCSFVLLFIDQLKYLYTSVYPYAMMKIDEQLQLFIRSLDWRRGLIRTIKWHPSVAKLAISLTNDDVFIYSSNNSIVPLLRHPMQKKVVDICWKDGQGETIAVVCETVFIVWDLTAAGISKSKARIPVTSAKIVTLDDIGQSAPLISGVFDAFDQRFLVSSPTTSLIIRWKDTKSLPENQNVSLSRPPSIPQHFSQPRETQESPKKDPNDEPVLDINLSWFTKRFGNGVIRLVWSPDNIRLLTLLTTNYIRVFERNSWTYRDWKIPFDAGDFVYAAVWSKPKGRFLLFSGYGDSSIYALPFYDSATNGCVGGEKNFFKILDLTQYEFPNGRYAGGAIQDMAWDKFSERLIVSFRDNPFLAVFKTNAKSILEIEPFGFIHGREGERALSIDFHDGFTRGSLLTIAWSSGVVSHIPFQYEPTQKKRATTSTPLTLRSLTTMCKSPLDSPIASPIHRGVVSTIDRSFLTPNRSCEPLATSRLLASDSVISPRAPPLFSCMKHD